ncbi:Oidioi.mRNA.OKI2018_I69.chr1.g3485.t1.cds [Oikopleura dioica]|uniref:Oidioi.mRNA.OKI2018_I69.chr1.g3485.t1.cds n=1 Tax=Oikopleura dioica TaxID=34765 RepID=A0ABN7SU39_OIKDI|nr:Oidioi.mRNA.OKI2018_I69.chr1.g3485.t1.cds [Oikopleura dioica]
MKLAATLVVVAAAGKNKEEIANTLLDLADNNTTTSDKNVARAQKWVDRVFAQARDLDTTYPCPEAEEDADSVLVFDQEDFCKLNGQLASALRSYIRVFGCPESYPKKNFPNTFAKRTNRMRNIFSRIADC